MELKVLDFKEFNHIEYKKIESKYENNPNPVTFTLDEFKSIVSLLFSVQYHTPEVSEEHLHNIAVYCMKNIQLSILLQNLGDK